MQIDETVHGCPVAVVHRIVRVEILALQVKSGPPRGNRLWLRPQATLCKERMKLTVETNLERRAAKCCESPVEERGAGHRRCSEAKTARHVLWEPGASDCSR